MMKSMTKIPVKLTGTACTKRPLAHTWLSNSPVEPVEYSVGSFTFFLNLACALAIVLPKSLSLNENFVVINRS